MLKPTVKRGLMLDFIPDEIFCAEKVNPNRVFKLNDKPIIDGDIVYLASRELRLEDNWAVQFGIDLAEKHNKKFKIIVILSKIMHSKRQFEILSKGLEVFKENTKLNKINFDIVEELPQNIGALIVDFNPINLFKNHTNYAVFEVDSHNIIPARYISQKQEFSAATLRRKIYAHIPIFLTEFANNFQNRSSIPTIQHELLTNFLNNKIDNYAELKNYPNEDVTSNLSPYLHFGLISSQRIALEVVKSNTSRINKEAFLEELIVRKELADNFCLYSKAYKTFDGNLDWAKATLNAHKSDIRTYLYDTNEFEYAKTHDKLWNKIQEGLLNAGKIHGYLRMYWAKKILEWSESPEEALKIAIYLNDTYALDGNDPNGYVGILWSLGGLHDRPFTNRFVTGKIRYMKGEFIRF